jgi:hypothetical protein
MHASLVWLLTMQWMKTAISDTSRPNDTLNPIRSPVSGQMFISDLYQ